MEAEGAWGGAQPRSQSANPPIGQFAILCAMKVYLIRHGAYAGWGDPGLSPAGMAQADAAGTALAAAGARPAAAIVSPYRRARETLGRVLAAAGAGDVPTQVCEDFTPGGDATIMAARVLALAPAGEVLVVGHMWSIGELARTLCREAPTVFGTCTTVALEGTPDGTVPTGDWTLAWRRDFGGMTR